MLEKVTEEAYENGALLHDKTNNLFGQMEVDYTEDNEPEYFRNVTPNLDARKVITFW